MSSKVLCLTKTDDFKVEHKFGEIVISKKNPDGGIDFIVIDTAIARDVATLLLQVIEGE